MKKILSFKEFLAESPVYHPTDREVNSDMFHMVIDSFGGVTQHVGNGKHEGTYKETKLVFHKNSDGKPHSGSIFISTPNGLIHSVADEAHIQQASQATLRLDECGLLVQSTMLRSADAEPQTAFLIDSDFFRDSSSYDLRPGKTWENLDALHGNADALFRRCITETLHNALGPTPI
jgi:hypothetical protein